MLLGYIDGMLYTHTASREVDVQENNKALPKEIYAVIGRAVSEVISAGQTLDKKSVLLMLQTQSGRTQDINLINIYQQAFRHLLESFH